jgi:hypothetical protein
MKEMATVHMSEAELARDLHGALARVRQGLEIVIEQDHEAIAVLSARPRGGRPIAEILRDAKRRNSTVALDEDFGQDLEEIVSSHNQAWSLLARD